MSEQVVRHGDEELYTCGAVSLLIESVDDLRTIIASRPSSTAMSVHQFDPEVTPFSSSRLDYGYDASEETSQLSGFIELAASGDDAPSVEGMMAAMYEYLVIKLDISENDIEEIGTGDTQVLNVQLTEELAISFSYDDSEQHPRVYMYTDFTAHHDPTREQRLIGYCLRAWGDLHDCIVWMSDESPDAPPEYALSVKRSDQANGAFVLWQSLMDYETWRESMAIRDLPRIDHSQIDVSAIGAGLEQLGRDDYDYIFSTVRALAVALRPRGESKLSNGELILALTAH
jgi:hypothetical protein